MIVKDKKMLAKYSGMGRCELCHCWCRRDPHHAISTRGMGGGWRLDVDINLLAVCRPCHDDIGRGVIGRGEVLQAVSRRMKMTPAEVEQKVWDLRRAPK